MSDSDRVIVALDCPLEEARTLARRLKGHARWLKVGMTLYYATGPAIVQEFKEMGYKVFVDLKLYDIPHQVRGAAASLVHAGADMFTIHGSGGLAMLQAAAEGVEEAFAERCKEYQERLEDGSSDLPADTASGIPKKPITLAITILTSMDEDVLEQVGVTRPLSEQVTALAKLAQEAGLSGVVASPQEAEALRELLGPEAVIVTPGVRPAGASVNDQSRTATPEQAIAAGASHLVIGRPITAAPGPLAAFTDIVFSL